jgi:phosphate transport system substrate-binding protein
MNRLSKTLKQTAIAVFALSAAATASFGDVKLQGAGATFPAPIYKEWIKQYTAAHPDVQIDYQAKGSGAGITGITDKTVDFAGSDAPMSEAELTKAGGNVVEIPSVAGGVAVAYNLPGFSGELKLTGPVVADIFMGNISKWSDPKIAAVNAGATLPDMPITVIVRGDKSGTTFVFTSYLATQSSDAKDVIGVDKTGNWPKAQRGEKSDGVTQLLKETKGGIGYIEENYASKNKLSVALLKNKSGKFVAPTAENVSAAAASAVSQFSGDKLVANLWDQEGDNAYPIATFTYLIVYKDLAYLKDEAKAKALVDFIKWATTEGQAKVAELDYAPVGAPVTAKIQETIGSLMWSGNAMRTAMAR